jgi:hypothetical protein
MCNLRQVMNSLVFIAFILVVPANAQEQSARTWVSGVGNDANDCSRAAPCRTFAGAIGKTVINGEINCLNPDGYGAVTITKSITIDCEDTQGAILGAFTNGIVVNLGAVSSSDPIRMVRVRGLTINGQGTGQRGIWVVRDANAAPITLHVEQVVIDGFNEGILFNPSGGELQVRNSIIQDCVTRGLMVDSGLAGQVVSATLEGSSFIHNQEGIRVETNAFVTAANCDISSNLLDGAIIQPAENYASDLNLNNCFIASNGQRGVSAIDNFGSGVSVRLSGNHIVSNSVAGVFSSALVYSRGNNTISGNSVDVQGAALQTLPSL